MGIPGQADSSRGTLLLQVMNEPHRGYIELLSPYNWDFNTDLAIGYFPSAVQS